MKVCSLRGEEDAYECCILLGVLFFLSSNSAPICLFSFSLLSSPLDLMLFFPLAFLFSSFFLY